MSLEQPRASFGDGGEATSQAMWGTSEVESRAYRPQKGTQARQCLDFSLGRAVSASDLEYYMIIKLCCFKPISLWWFVMAANRKPIHGVYQ